MVDRLELVSGTAPWLARMQALAVLCAFAGLLFADTPVHVKLGSLALLAFALLLERAVGGGRYRHRYRLVLDRDGQVEIYSGHGSDKGNLRGTPWISPWLSVLSWQPLNARSTQHILICASLNREDDYRRLLVWTRLSPRLSGKASA